MLWLSIHLDPLVYLLLPNPVQPSTASTPLTPHIFPSIHLLHINTLIEPQHPIRYQNPINTRG
jgi:hypothetical protein